MDIVGEVDRVRVAVAAAGRDPATFQIVAYGARPTEIESLIAADIDHTIFNLRPLGTSETVGYLDRLAGEIPLT
jgi:hypothetical protein